MAEIFQKRLALIIIIPMVSVITAAMVSLLMTPVYLASTTIMVATVGGQDPISNFNSLNLNRQLVKTYGELAVEHDVLQEVANHINGISADELPDKITVTPVKDLELLRISVRDNNPEMASFIANLMVHVLQEKTMQLYESDNIKVISYAQVPVKPERPDFLKNIAAALVAGLIVAVIISLWVEEKSS